VPTPGSPRSRRPSTSSTRLPAKKRTFGGARRNHRGVPDDRSLGSLLDVQGTLAEEFMEEQTDVMEWGRGATHAERVFETIRCAVVDERTSDSFGEQNLRSFLNLLVVLTQDYDVALMNPPYGMGGRMPNGVKEYVENHYDYYPNITLVSSRHAIGCRNPDGRVGMLFRGRSCSGKSFQDFRTDFVGGRGDLISSLNSATTSSTTRLLELLGLSSALNCRQLEIKQTGTFIRLPDVSKEKKEAKFIESSFVESNRRGPTTISA